MARKLRQKARLARQRRIGLIERLEDRRMMAVASQPNQPLTVANHPIAAQNGYLDANSTLDVVTLSQSGILSVALNSGNNSWSSTRTLDLGLGRAYGMTSGLINADGHLDLVVAGRNAVNVLHGDRQGGFTLRQSIAAPGGSTWLASTDTVALALGRINHDPWLDLALVDATLNRLYVWFGRADGSFDTTEAVPSGAAGFSIALSSGSIVTALGIGDLVGDAHTDMVVGYQDGTLHFIEGLANRTWQINSSATLRRSSAIRSLAIADLDGDLDLDIAVSTATGAVVLLQNPDPLATSPIINGSFSQGLEGWTVKSQGHASWLPSARAGEVKAVGGGAQLTEYDSFLTSLSQQFRVPDNPQRITLDIEALQLENQSGAIPDVLEISLLATTNQSLLPPHRPTATSLFNIATASSGQLQTRTGPSTTFDGRTVTIDISQLAPGTLANLMIDLVGNPPGISSSVTIDNVEITPAAIFGYGFTEIALPGSFQSPGAIRSGDVNGDTLADIVLVDQAANEVIVFNGVTPTGWQRSTISSGTLGVGPTDLTLGDLNDDGSLDIAYTLTAPARLLSPIGSIGRCLPVLDFELDAQGKPISSGSRDLNLFSPWGVQIQANSPGAAQPVIANWAQSYLSSPSANTVGNVIFLADSSSNAGTTGASGSDNSIYQGGSGLTAAAGTLTLSFSSPVQLDELAVLGILASGSARIKLYDPAGNLLREQAVSGNSHGARMLVPLDATNVGRLSIDLPAGAALADLTFCRLHLPGGAVQIAGPTVVNEGEHAIYDFLSPQINAAQWLVNWGDGQVEHYSSDAPIIMHRYADGPAMRKIYAWAEDRAGNIFLAPSLSVKVLNVPPTLIVSAPPEVESGRAFQLQLSPSDPGDDRITKWTVHWGDGATSTANSPTASLTHYYRNRTGQPVTFTVTVSARDEDNPSGAAYTASPIQVVVQPDASTVLPTIDFERGASGVRLRAGDYVTDQYAALGMTITAFLANKPTLARPAMIVDSANPIHGAKDLGTPNKDFHGPGHGLGGGAGKPGENRLPLGNVLVIPKSTNSAYPEDYEYEGTLRFTFSSPVQLDEVHLLDIHQSGSVIRLFDAHSRLIGQHSIAKLGTNSFQVVQLNSSQVSRMDIVLTCGGAVAAIVSERGTPAIARPETRYYVVDSNDRTYRYSVPGADIGEFTMDKHVNARGITTWTSGNPVWIVSEEGAQDRVIVFDTETERQIGAWTIANRDLTVEGIATDGTNIWIVDARSDRVYRFAGAAARRSGTIWATDSFMLARTNGSPTDIVTDGQLFWVVDSSADRVFVYNQRGSLVNQWLLDINNTEPTGIAINPRANEGIYVLDAKQKRVYSYPQRLMPSVVRQRNSGSFPLARGNNAPTGLVDPGGETTIGAVVSDRIATAGAVDEWSFDALAGTRIYVNFQAVSDTLQAELIAPNGQSLYNKTSFRPSGLDSGSLQLTTSGPHRLRLTSATTASYQFQIFDIPPPDTNAITFGQLHEGALDSPGRPDHWLFTGTAGQRYTLDFLTLETVVGGDLIAEIVAPSGQVVSSRFSILPNSLDQSFTLTENGQHRLELYAAFDGSHLPRYSFQLFQVPADDVSALAFRQVASGGIEVPGARDRWLLNATAGQSIFVDMQQITGGDLQLQILRPDGQLLSSRTFSLPFGLDQALLLPQTGTYTFILDGGGSSSLNTYRFQVFDLPPESVERTLINTTLFGTTVPGQRDQFEFFAEAGTPILMDVIESAERAVGVTILQPDGQPLIERATTNQWLTLPQTGNYLVSVGSSSTVFIDGAGPYRFRVQDARSPTLGNRDSLGTRFVLAFPANLREPFAPNNPAFSLTIASPTTTSGTVHVPGLGFSTTYTVQAGLTTTVQLPADVELGTSDLITNRAVIVTALDEVAVYGLNQLVLLTEGFTALPVDALGREYYVLGYPNTANIVTDGGSSLTVAATVDATEVTITPTVTIGSRIANVPYTIMLDSGQAYTLHAFRPLGADLSGTKIVSNAPLAVFGGNTAALVPAGNAAANHLVEQMPPTDAWGQRFMTVPLATRSGGDTFRVMAQRSGTELRINGVLTATLAAGQVWEGILASASLIEGSAPFLVAQYSNGSTFDNTTADPFMMLVTPTEQYLQQYTLSTPANGFPINYANLVVPVSSLNSVTRNGQAISASAFTVVGNTGLAVARLPISVGTHRFGADAPLGVSIYGYANFDGYGYFGGMQVGPIAQATSLTLIPPSVSLPLNSQHILTATASNSSGQLLSNVRIDFVVTEVDGTVVQRRSVISNTEGQANLTLTRATAGTYNVTASLGGLTQSASASWQTATPSINLITPTSGSNLPVGKHLIHGRAHPGPTGARIAELTINGVRVQSIDAAGYFFAPVDLSAGQQTYTLRAVNSFGAQASRVVTLIGQEPNDQAFDIRQANDLTNGVSVHFLSPTFNRSTSQLLVQVQLTNDGSLPIDPSVALRFDKLEPSSVSVVAPDLVTDDSRPVLLMDDQLGSDGLLPSESSSPLSFALSNPDRARIALHTSVLVEGNRAPRFVSTPEPLASVGRTYRYQAIATDPDSQRLNYQLLRGPEGMTINAQSGQLSWTIPEGAVGSQQVAIEVSDGRGGSATQAYTLLVAAAAINRPPLFTSPPITGTLPGSDYRYLAAAMDPDGDSVTFELTQAPADMRVDPFSGLVSFNSAAAGQYVVALRASDGRGGVAVQNFTLSVGSGDGISSPAITSTPPTSAISGALYSYSVAAVDRPGATLTYTLLSAPDGMSIQAGSGHIAWQPGASDVGTNRLVQVRVSNAQGGASVQSYTVTVLAQQPNAAPQFTSTPVTLATVGLTYFYASVAVDPEQQALTYSLISGPSSMIVNPTTGRIAWIPKATELGARRILIAASDPQGLVGYQAYTISVRQANTAPSFVSLPQLSATVGSPYRTDALAVDEEGDEVSYTLIAAPPGMLIDSQGGAVTWGPGLASIGQTAVTIRATDARGLSADQSFTILVAGDTEPPSVSISLSQTSIEPGETVTIQVTAGDNVRVASITLAENNLPISLDPQGRAEVTKNSSGIYRFTATAVDTSGNQSIARAALQVREPRDATPPTVVIHSPAAEATISYLTNIVATVTDENLVEYVLEYSRINSNAWRTIVRRSALVDSGPIDVLNQMVGQFDPTLLLNDQYQVRLVATDINDQTTTAAVVLSITGNAKIGTLEIPASEVCRDCGSADVTIAVAGGPTISIARQYSTLYTEEAGDFGQGWQFCMAEPNIRETAARSEFENVLGQLAAVPFRAGQKVYITAPDCQRIGFTFSPTPHTGIWSEISSRFYDPRWIPDPGVDWQLYGESDFLRLTGIASGEFDLAGLPLPLVRFADDQFILAGISASYNPEGYQLISKDGTRYYYSQTEGLINVTDRNGNRLTMTDDGITSSSGQGVRFQRDTAGRITRVIDDQGREIQYSYNAAGQLERVEYPHGLADTFRYRADYLLAGINGDNEQQEMLTRDFQYDIAGRLAVVLDAFGYRNTQIYDMESRTQTIFDALGNPTVSRFDDRGNITYQRSPNGDEFSMEYDANDNRTRVIDELGFEFSMEYDQRRNLTRFVDALGNTTEFVYNSANFVVLQRDAQGNEYTYQYDQNQNIVGATGPAGAQSSLTYDTQGRLLSFTDVEGRVRRYEYGNQSVPTRLVNRDGTSMQFTYNIYGHLTETIDELGRVSRVVYDEGQRPVEFMDELGHSVRLIYRGRSIEQMIDQAGFVTRYEYDAEFRPTRLIRADATSQSNARSGGATGSELMAASFTIAGGATSMEYDPRGLRTSLTDANGNRRTFSYRADGRMATETDANGNTVAFEYDAVGRQTAVIDANGGIWRTEYNALSFVTATLDPLGNRNSMTHDLMGNVISSTDALGRTTFFEYNSIQRPTRIINPEGRSIHLEYTWDGRLLSERDELGRVTSYQYDEMNRLITVIDPLGATERYRYDAAGNQTALIDKRGAITHMRYDGLNRLIETIDPAGAVVSLTYDQRGNLAEVVDALGGRRRYEYDRVGRVIGTVDQLGAVSTVTYDLMGNVVSSQDALGRVNQYEYDKLNRLSARIDPLGARTAYAYDRVGNLVSVIDPVGNTTQFTYDRSNRWLSSIDPLGNVSSRSYDQVGNIVATVDREGRRMEFTYDAIDRLVAEQWLGGGAVTNSISYSYDAVSNLLVAADNFSRLTQTYDALNRMTSTDNAGTPGAPRVLLSYGYDANDNRTSVLDSAGISVVSTYDARNLLSSRTWSGGGVAAARVDWNYDARGLPVSLRRSPNLDGATGAIGTTLKQYDAKGRLSEIAHNNALGQSLVAYSYVRDPADQLIQETHHGQSRVYQRDAFGQLISASIDGLPTESFQYDANGNRLGQGEVLGADNRLQENATHRFAYDREGNLIRKVDKVTGEVQTFTYDHRQRLVVSTRLSNTGVLLSRVVNRYDVFNRRIARSEDPDGAGPLSATTMHTVYDGDHAWADYSTTGALMTRYMFGDQVDEILARWRPGQGTVWYLTDHLGSVRDMTDALGAVINTIDYDSFGRIAGQTNAAITDRFTYTGREWDAALQLFYYRSRFYDPTTGRFLSQDRLGFAAGDMNLYRYVGNNPLDYTDPSGDLAMLECAQVRALQTVVSITCSVLDVAFRDGFTSDRIDKQIENVFSMMSIAFSVLPFGSSKVLQATMKAITIVQTAQALASLNINEQLFNVLEIAETYVKQAIDIYQKGAVATFQEALAAFSKSDNKKLIITRLLCAAANMGLMVLSAYARCFVAGTPVLVGVRLDRPEIGQEQWVWESRTFDIAAGLAVCILLWPKRPQSAPLPAPAAVANRQPNKKNRQRELAVDRALLEWGTF